MSGFNLSEWAIKNRSVVIFLMIVSVAAGASAFYQLGRAEDPPFTFRTMVVSAAWPGATPTTCAASPGRAPPPSLWT